MLRKHATAAPSFAPEIKAWLQATPSLPRSEILQRAREAGYRGGKSALYDLIRRLLYELVRLQNQRDRAQGASALGEAVKRP
jgi:hypothetical protein